MILFFLACGIRRSTSRLHSTTDQGHREAPRIGRSLQGILTQQHGDEPIHVIVGYKDGRSPDPDWIQANSLKVENVLKNVNAAGAVISKDQMELLLSNPNVSYIEEDAVVYPASIRETIPWGVRATQGNAIGISRRYATELSRNTCSDPSSLKVALIDSGVDWNHPDIPCTSLNETNTNCIGREFGLDDTTERWYNPSDAHGTHVFGTFAGARTNGVGVSGMLTDSSGICFIVCQIFSKSRNARASTVIEAAQWAIEKGATVINMSLSTSVFLKGFSHCALAHCFWILRRSCLRVHG
jgi:subtilisin family serine protease